MRSASGCHPGIAAERPTGISTRDSVAMPKRSCRCRPALLDGLEAKYASAHVAAPITLSRLISPDLIAWRVSIKLLASMLVMAASGLPYIF